MVTKPELNNYILKKDYAKFGKGQLLFAEEGATIDGDYYLEVLKKYLQIIFLIKGKFSTI